MDSNSKGRTKKGAKPSVIREKSSKDHGRDTNLRVIHQRSKKDRRMKSSARTNGRRKEDTGSSQAPQLQVEILEETFAVLSPRGGELVEKFYDELFHRYPSVRPLFAGVKPETQQRKLLSALALVVANLRKPAALNNPGYYTPFGIRVPGTGDSTCTHDRPTRSAAA